MKAPIARKQQHEYEIHGMKISENYFWLRNKEDPQVIDYLKAENEYTEEKMKHTEDGQKKLYDEMKSRIKETDETVPYKYGDYFYYSRTVEGKQYTIYCRKKDSVENAEEIVLDLNILAEGKSFLSLRSYEISPDHTKVAYTLDEDGYENFTLYIKDLNTNEITDRIDKVSGSILWGDDNTIYYTTNDEIHRPYRVFLHKLGQKDDSKLFQEDDTTRFVGMHTELDRKYLIIHSDSINSSEARFIDLKSDNSTPQLFLERKDGHEYELSYHEEYFYIVTNENAINFKVMRVAINNFSKDNWTEYIPHRDNVRINGLSFFKNYIMVHKRIDGVKQIEVMDLANTDNSHQIEMPEPFYSIHSGPNREYDTDEFRFYYSSLVTPMTTYDYEIKNRKLIMKKQEEVKGHNSDDYVSKREFAQARDGKKIPISIVHKKGVENGPALLYGYGSYGITIDTNFSPNLISLLQRGMIYAIAHVRGSEFLGKPWYEDGKMLNKRNTFTDFNSVAEHLIKKNYTSSDKLAIMGGSAGGLLMGACVNMRPDLFKLAVAAVPFVDVMNTMLDDSIPLTTHEYEEWGNPNIKEYFDYMMSYSPYDNVEAKDYPIILVTAGLNDPRVHYWEPAKWVAKLRALKTDDNLLLLKTNMGAGHSGASGRYEYLKEIAFRFAFILDNLGITI